MARSNRTRRSRPLRGFPPGMRPPSRPAAQESQRRYDRHLPGSSAPRKRRVTQPWLIGRGGFLFARWLVCRGLAARRQDDRASVTAPAQARKPYLQGRAARGQPGGLRLSRLRPTMRGRAHPSVVSKPRSGADAGMGWPPGTVAPVQILLRPRGSSRWRVKSTVATDPYGRFSARVTIGVSGFHRGPLPGHRATPRSQRRSATCDLPR